MLIDRIIFYFCMLASISLLCLLPSCTPPTPAQHDQAPLAVRTIGVRSGTIRQTLGYVGTVHSQNEIKVLARVVGKVSYLPFKEGQMARRGSVLVYIAAPEMNSRVSRLRAEVSRAQQESAFLCQQSETDHSLFSSKVISKLKSDASRQKCESSKAALKAAQAGLNELMVLAGNTVERAPFNGRVLQWLTEPGENTMPGKPILMYGDELLEIRVKVHEKDISSGIKEGTVVLISTRESNPIRTKVSFIAPMALGPGRMVEVRIPLLTSRPNQLQHGMSVDVDFVLREKTDASMVPVDSIITKDNESGVYVAKREKAVWKNVAPSIKHNGWIAIDSGLEDGDRVVVSNLDVVRDGMKIYPVDMERTYK